MITNSTEGEFLGLLTRDPIAVLDRLFYQNGFLHCRTGCIFKGEAYVHTSGPITPRAILNPSDISCAVEEYQIPSGDGVISTTHGRLVANLTPLKPFPGDNQPVPEIARRTYDLWQRVANDSVRRFRVKRASYSISRSNGVVWVLTE